MAWITLSTEDIRSRLAAAELSALSSAALAEGQSDPLPEVITQVVDQIRGSIAGNQQNTLGPSGTLPERLKSAALNIIRFELATRLPFSNESSPIKTSLKKP